MSHPTARGSLSLRQVFAGIAVVASLVYLAAVVRAGAASAAETTGIQSGDTLRAELESAVREIFDAFIARDADKIRRLHADDWLGFATGSETLMRGIEAYMSGVNLANPILDYELTELEVDGNEELAIVYYVAVWRQRITPLNQTARITARAVDVFRQRNGRWIQTGSNINVIPTPGYERMPACLQCFQVQMESAR